MMFWILSAAMVVLVAALLARVVLRPPEAGAQTPAFDVQVYRDQLAEVERDVARGVLTAEDATRARTEISRRILTADAAADVAAPAHAGPRPAALIAIVAVLALVPFGLYAMLGAPGYGDLALQDRIDYAETLRKNRPSQQVAEDSIPDGILDLELSPDDARLLQLLRDKVGQSDGDIQGYRLLSSYEAKAGNFAEAVAAQQILLDLLGPQTDAQDVANYGEYLVLAAGGYVSPEAEVAFREVLNRENDNGSARYYLGLMLVQTGRPDQAFRIWDTLLRRGPENAPWIAPIQRQIMSVAPLAGVDYTMPAVGLGDTRGPSSEDIEAASEMTAEDRMQMIGGMVTGLSNRLATEGGPPQDWARLITSLGVLNETTRARAIYDNALEVFAGNDGALDMIRAAGSQAGIAE